jgi:hypothetical protein
LRFRGSRRSKNWTCPGGPGWKFEFEKGAERDFCKGAGRNGRLGGDFESGDVKFETIDLILLIRSPGTARTPPRMDSSAPPDLFTNVTIYGHKADVARRLVGRFRPNLTRDGVAGRLSDSSRRALASFLDLEHLCHFMGTWGSGPGLDRWNSSPNCEDGDEREGDGTVTDLIKSSRPVFAH